MNPNIQKNKIKALVAMTIAAVLFIFFFIVFHLDGVKVDYKNIMLLVETIFTTGILLVGLYLGLYFYSGKKLANQIGGGMVIFLILAYVIGYLIHG